MPTETPQDQPVDTGLELLQAPAPEPKPDKEISFAEPISAADLTAGVADTPEEARPVLTEAQMAALQAEANRDETKREFTLKVLAARAKKAEPDAPPPPLAPRIAEQTNAEIAAGRKMNEHHASLQVHRHPPEQTNEKHQAVFRPADYVPDQKKGQGYTQGQKLGQQ